MASDDEYLWRETCFVFFPAERRPSAQAVEESLAALPGHLKLSGVLADDQGRFESLTLRSEADASAVEVSYDFGPEVREQAEAMADEFSESASPTERRALVKLAQCDSRFDVMHFELMSDDNDDADAGNFDPSTLLQVVEALTKLTHGIGVDPQSGLLL